MSASPIIPPNKELRIHIVGTGGVASYLTNHSLLSLLCTRFPRSILTFHDKDELELRNFERQSFVHGSSGNKAVAKVNELKNDPRYSVLDFRVHQGWITPSNVAEHIQEGDLVFSCVDNHATRKVLSQRLEDLVDGILIAGGNTDATHQALWYIRKDGEDLTPPLTTRSEIKNPKDKGPWEMSCEELAQIAPQTALANEGAAYAMKNMFFTLTQVDQVPYLETRGSVLQNVIYTTQITNKS